MRDHVIYYADPVNDDFAENSITPKTVGRDFPFIHKSRLWNAFGTGLYYVLGIPLAALITKVYLGLRLENKEALGQLRGQGFYLYGNHTRALDALLPSLAAFPHRAFVVANRDAVSIPLLQNLVLMLGCIPIPSEFSGMGPFLEAVQQRCAQGHCVAIFPEAHIWPFYTGIRPFPDTSFRYPVKSGAPVVAMVTTYRKRLLLKRPAMTVTLSQPMYPDPSLPPKQARQDLCRRVHDFMEETAKTKENVEWIRYEYRPTR